MFLSLAVWANFLKVLRGRRWPWREVSLPYLVLRVRFSPASSLQCRCIFGGRTLSTSSRNLWPRSWILKAEEGWGETEISTKGVGDRRTSLAYNANLRSLIRRLYCRLARIVYICLAPSSVFKARLIGKSVVLSGAYLPDQTIFYN